jgi:hypothetical protein
MPALQDNSAARSGERAHNLLLNAAGKRLLDGLPSHVVAATERKPGSVFVTYIDWAWEPTLPR